jgi:hypothetical protein
MRRLIAPIAALALVACSGDVCSQSENLSQSLAHKVAPCIPPDAGFNAAALASVESCSTSACEKALPSCSNQDQQTMQRLINCEQQAVDSFSGNCTDQAALEVFAFAVLACDLGDGGFSFTISADGGTAASPESPYSAACTQAMATAATACGLDGGA